MVDNDRTGRQKRRRGRAASRDAIMRAASGLFARHGYDGTSVEEIVRAARVNKAMISYYFGGKRELYREIIAAGFDAAEPRMRELAASSAAADERLRMFVRGLTGVFGKSPVFPMIILREVLSGGSRLDEKLFPRFVSIFETLRRLLEDGIRKKVFRPVDPLATHLALIGSLLFFFSTIPFRERMAAKGKLPAEPPPPEGYVAHIEEMFIRGLRPGGGPKEKTR